MCKLIHIFIENGDMNIDECLFAPRDARPKARTKSAVLNEDRSLSEIEWRRLPASGGML